MNPKIPRQREMKYFEMYTHNTVRACVIVSEMCTTQTCEIFHPVPKLWSPCHFDVCPFMGRAFPLPRQQQQATAVSTQYLGYGRRRRSTWPLAVLSFPAAS